MKKEYSILMSVYYNENPIWFDNSINSMFEQTLRPKEFILVEDGKLTEELDEVVNKYLKEFPEIFKVVKLERNVGLGIALKIGIEECSCEYIARMDSDDYSVPNRIEKEFEVFEKDNNIGMVGSNVAEFIDNIENIICNVALPENYDDIIKFSKKRNPFRHPSIMFKKSEVLKAGNYREYYLCEDYDMWLRMLRNNCKCYNIQENLVFMRISKDFYKRRGGIKYLKSINKLKKEQMSVGYFSKIEYLKSIIPHAIVCLMPNFMRNFIYKKMLRKGIK